MSLRTELKADHHGPFAKRTSIFSFVDRFARLAGSRPAFLAFEAPYPPSFVQVSLASSHRGHVRLTPLGLVSKALAVVWKTQTSQERPPASSGYGHPFLQFLVELTSRFYFAVSSVKRKVCGIRFVKELLKLSSCKFVSSCQACWSEIRTKLSYGSPDTFQNVPLTRVFSELLASLF